MYYKVQELKQKGMSFSGISKVLGINKRTVMRYCCMTDEAFETFIAKTKSRSKLLSAYEPFLVKRLQEAPLASSAQAHDWLKEKFPDFPVVTQKTVYNFVMAIRQHYNIPIEKPSRDMMMVDELPYGKQAQVDFGVYNMTTEEGKRKKVCFFAIVLSRSRMKYVFFQDKPFTTKTTIEAHEKAFAFFNGIPHELVYDQDRVLLVSENSGELILTSEFKTYVQSHKLGLHFCRKSDPQSKGRTENLVGYTKHNFLYGRRYSTLEALQQQAVAWLDRTANINKHSVTNLSPKAEWEKEVSFLRPFISAQVSTAFEQRTVRQDNTICHKSVYYSVPSGTYREGAVVLVDEKDGILSIRPILGSEVWTHEIPKDKSKKKVLNNNHRRDTTLKIAELKQAAAKLFPDSTEASKFLDLVHKQYPRYVRDQVTGIMKAIELYPPEITGLALAECLKMKQYKLSVFKETLQTINAENAPASKPLPKVIPILKNKVQEKADIQPAQRSLDVYDSLINKA